MSRAINPGWPLLLAQLYDAHSGFQLDEGMMIVSG